MPRVPARLIAVLTGLILLGQMATSLYVPSLPFLDDELQTDSTVVKLTMTVFLWAFALSQLLYGPLSDRYGRRPVLLWGIVVYLVGTATCAFAPGIEVLILGRTLQGVGACAGSAIYRAVVRDLFDREGGARVLASVGIAVAIGPAIGPMIGGELQVAFGWRASFAVMTLLGLVVAAAVLLALPETNPRLDPAATRPAQIVANYRLLLTNRVFLAYVVIIGGQFGGLLVYTTGLPFVLIDLHGYAANQLGYVFVYTVAGFFFGAWLSGRMLALGHGPDRTMRIGAAVQITGASAMLLFALLGAASPAAIITPQVLFMIGFGLICPSALSSSVMPFPLIAGTAAALHGFFQMAIAGAAVVVLAALYSGSPTPMAFLIFLSACGSGLGLLAVNRPVPAR